MAHLVHEAKQAIASAFLSRERNKISCNIKCPREFLKHKLSKVSTGGPITKTRGHGAGVSKSKAPRVLPRAGIGRSRGPAKMQILSVGPGRAWDHILTRSQGRTMLQVPAHSFSSSSVTCPRQAREALRPRCHHPRPGHSGVLGMTSCRQPLDNV